MPSTLLTALVSLLRMLPPKIRGIVWELCIVLFLTIFVAVMPRDMGGYGWHPPALAVRIVAAVVTFLMLLARANLSFNGSTVPNPADIITALGQFSPTALPALTVPESVPTGEDPTTSAGSNVDDAPPAPDAGTPTDAATLTPDPAAFPAPAATDAPAASPAPPSAPEPQTAVGI